MAQSIPPQAGNNPQTSICSIASLNPDQNRWQIRAKVTQKTDKTPYKTTKKEGIWFSVRLTDESGEIRAVAYNDNANKYYAMLEDNKIYFISNGCVNLNESKRKGDYEIVLNADTTVKLSTEDVDLLSVKFNSATIKELDSKTLGNTVEGAACNALLDNASSLKQEKEDQIFGLTTSSLLHGTSPEKNPEEACGSKGESGKGSKEEKFKKSHVNFTEEEKTLTLQHFVSLNTWDTLITIIYEHRKDKLSSDMVENYEYVYEKNKLTDRIKRYIKKVHKEGVNEKETDNIKALVKKMQSITLPRDQR